jgi:hypothetical protein
MRDLRTWPFQSPARSGPSSCAHATLSRIRQFLHEYPRCVIVPGSSPTGLCPRPSDPSRELTPAGLAPESLPYDPVLAFPASGVSSVSRSFSCRSRAWSPRTEEDRGFVRPTERRAWPWPPRAQPREPAPPRLGWLPFQVRISATFGPRRDGGPFAPRGQTGTCGLGVERMPPGQTATDLRLGP